MSTGQAWAEQAAGIAEPIGGLWLNALQMTIVPLVVSLLITGIAGAARGGAGEPAGDAGADPVRLPAARLLDPRGAR